MSASSTAVEATGRWGRWLERLEDRVNPIVIRELRQAVQGKLLAGLLLFFLAVQVLVVGGFLLSGAGQGVQAAGQSAFLALQGILLFVALFFLPILVTARLFRERSDQNLDLMFITTLSPKSIIRGKLYSGLVLLILLFSAGMPFLVLTYFLRGIALPSILLVVAASFLAVAMAIQVGIFLGCLARHRLLRLLIGIFGLLQLFTVYTFLQTGMAFLLYDSWGSRLDSWEFWGWVALWLGLALLGSWALFVLSVALISPSTSNRARPVRKFFTVAWVATLVAVLVASFLTKNADFMVGWLTAVSLVLASTMFVAICAPDLPSRRVLSRLPAAGERFGRIRRRIAFVMSSGAAGGLAWSGLLAVATVAAGTLASMYIGRAGGRQEITEATGRSTSFLAYCLAFALVALFLQRHWSSKIQRSQTWVLLLVLLAASLVLPLIAALLISPYDDVDWALLLSPLGAMTDLHLPIALLISGSAAAVMTMLHVPWFLRQVDGFKATAPAAPPASLDAAPSPSITTSSVAAPSVVAPSVAPPVPDPATTLDAEAEVVPAERDVSAAPTIEES